MSKLLHYISEIDSLIQGNFKEALETEFHVKRDGNALVVTSILKEMKLTSVLREGESILDCMLVVEVKGNPITTTLRKMMENINTPA